MCLLCFLFLTGCKSAKSDYLISSIGFDYKEGWLETSFEAVISNSETDKQNVELITGKGKTVEKSVAEIKKQCTQKILLSHCAVIVIGETVPQEQLDQIYEYCFKTQDITLSAIFVRTQNAKKLLSQKPVSTIAVGYDILSLTEQSQNKIKNRYFEIMAKNKKVDLPEITLTKEGYYLEK